MSQIDEAKLYAAIDDGNLKAVQSAWIASDAPRLDTEYAKEGAGKGWSTPLMRAATQGKLDIVQFLAQNGADTRLKDMTGSTAADMARRHHRDVAQWLESHQTQPDEAERRVLQRQKSAREQRQKIAEIRSHPPPPPPMSEMLFRPGTKIELFYPMSNQWLSLDVIAMKKPTKRGECMREVRDPAADRQWWQDLSTSQVREAK